MRVNNKILKYQLHRRLKNIIRLSNLELTMILLSNLELIMILKIYFKKLTQQLINRNLNKIVLNTQELILKVIKFLRRYQKKKVFSIHQNLMKKVKNKLFKIIII